MSEDEARKVAWFWLLLAACFILALSLWVRLAHGHDSSWIEDPVRFGPVCRYLWIQLDLPDDYVRLMQKEGWSDCDRNELLKLQHPAEYPLLIVRVTRSGRIRVRYLADPNRIRVEPFHRSVDPHPLSGW